MSRIGRGAMWRAPHPSRALRRVGSHRPQPFRPFTIAVVSTCKSSKFTHPAQPAFLQNLEKIQLLCLTGV
jgi:hypothetical protein